MSRQSKSLLAGAAFGAVAATVIASRYPEQSSLVTGLVLGFSFGAAFLGLPSRPLSLATDQDSLPEQGPSSTIDQQIALVFRTAFASAIWAAVTAVLAYCLLAWLLGQSFLPSNSKLPYAIPLALMVLGLWGFRLVRILGFLRSGTTRDDFGVGLTLFASLLGGFACLTVLSTMWEEGSFFHLLLAPGADILLTAMIVGLLLTDLIAAIIILPALGRLAAQQVDQERKAFAAACSSSPSRPSSFSSGPGLQLQGFGADREHGAVLRDIHCTLPNDGSLLVRGREGSGRTTFLGSLLGLVPVTQGEISVLGLDPQRKGASLREVTGVCLGNVTATPDMIPSLTWLKLVGEIYGLSKEDASLRARHLLRRFGLRENKTCHRGSSQAFRARLQLAACLMPSPAMLLLDTWTRGLDTDAWPILAQELSFLRQDKALLLVVASGLAGVPALSFDHTLSLGACS